MAPRTTVLGEIITYDRLGDYYLKEIILRRSRSWAPSQPSNAQPKNPLHVDHLPVSTSLQMFKKKKKRALQAYIRSKQSECFILVFRVH